MLYNLHIQSQDYLIHYFVWLCGNGFFCNVVWFCRNGFFILGCNFVWLCGNGFFCNVVWFCWSVFFILGCNFVWLCGNGFFCNVVWLCWSVFFIIGCNVVAFSLFILYKKSLGLYTCKFIIKHFNFSHSIILTYVSALLSIIPCVHGI